MQRFNVYLQTAKLKKQIHIGNQQTDHVLNGGCSNIPSCKPFNIDISMQNGLNKEHPIHMVTQ